MDENLNTGANEDGSAAGNQGNNEQNAGAGGEQNLNAGAGGEQNAGAGGEQNQNLTDATMVPFSVLKSVREELKSLKAQNSIYENHFASGPAAGVVTNSMIPDASLNSPNAGVNTPAGQDPFAGHADEDLLTVGSIKGMLAGMANGGVNPQMMNTIQNIQLTLAKNEMAGVDKDFEAKIRTYLPSVINSNPGVSNAIMASPNPLRAAYEFAKVNPEFANFTNDAGAGAGASVHDQINQIISNAGKPGSPSAVGAGGAALDKVDKFASMSDSDFDAHVAKVMSGEG